MSYSNHLLTLSDTECMIVYIALENYRNSDVHEIDKRLAEEIRERLHNVVSKDKTIYKPKRCTRTYYTCSDCKWLDTTQKKSVGYKCVNPNRKWRSNTAQWHSPSCKACKCGFERQEE